MALAAAQARADPAQAPQSGAKGAKTTVEDAQDGASDVPEPLLQPVMSLFTRYEARVGYDRLDLPPPSRLRADQDAFYYRARFGLQTRRFRLNDALAISVRFVPQSSGVWHVGGDTLTDAQLGMHEGLLQLHGPGFRLDVGRFEMVYGEHFVIGNVGWHETGRSFDGARLHLTARDGDVWVDTFFTVLREGFVEAPQYGFSTGDTYFGGVYAGVGELLRDGLALDAYALALASPKSTDPDTGEDRHARGRVTLGARAKERVGALDYRVEAGAQLGRDRARRTIVAYQGDLEVGVHMAEDVLRLALEGFFASGDDPGTGETNEAWNHLFPTAHKWLGYADIIGPRTNVGGGVVHVDVTPSPAWHFYADGHLFARPEPTQRPAGVAGPGLAGYEVDVGGRYVIASKLRVRAGYSLFVPDEDWFGTSTPAHFAELELRYDH